MAALARTPVRVMMQESDSVRIGTQGNVCYEESSLSHAGLQMRSESGSVVGRFVRRRNRAINAGAGIVTSVKFVLFVSFAIGTVVLMPDVVVVTGIAVVVLMPVIAVVSPLSAVSVHPPPEGPCQKGCYRLHTSYYSAEIILSRVFSGKFSGVNLDDVAVIQRVIKPYLFCHSFAADPCKTAARTVAPFGKDIGVFVFFV